jgi:hypothetical protein
MNEKEQQVEYESMLEESHSFWRANARTQLGESIRSVEATAKQLIVVVGILEGLYFHAIAYSRVRGQLSSTWLVIIYMLPLAFWLSSLLFGLLVFFPRPYETNVNSWRESKTTFEQIVTYKHTMLKVSGIFLLLGGLALAVTMGIYLVG